MGRSKSCRGFLLLEVMVAFAIFTSIVGLYAWYQGQTLACYRICQQERQQLGVLGNALEGMFAGDVNGQDVVYFVLPSPSVRGFLAERGAVVPCVVRAVAVHTNPRVSLIC